MSVSILKTYLKGVKEVCSAIKLFILQFSKFPLNGVHDNDIYFTSKCDSLS